MNVLFTICGRAGSKGFKNKNLKELNGIPLVYYTLAAIKGFQDQYNDGKVYVALNTDSEELFQVVKKQEILNEIIYVERKPELGGDMVAKVDVIRDTFLSTYNDIFPDVVIDLDITSPMRSVADIANVFNEFNTNPKFDVVFSVVESRRSPYFNMVEGKDDGFFHKICDSKFTARQQAPKCYEMNASIYAYSPDFLKNEIERTILDYNCGVSMMKDYLVLDIDSEEDFCMMSMLHNFYIDSDSGIKEVYNLAKKF